jgi:hypothetical protein
MTARIAECGKSAVQENRIVIKSRSTGKSQDKTALGSERIKGYAGNKMS